MKAIFDPIVSPNGMEALRIVDWSDKYAIDIDLIDTQHKELINLTNELYKACLINNEGLSDVFKEAMSRMVEYVRFHFAAEMKLLERIQFPDRHNHKKQHDELVKNILDAVKEQNEGKKFVPNNFVRTLEDWIFGHIGIYDQIYASFVRDQKNKGLLKDSDLG